MLTRLWDGVVATDWKLGVVRAMPVDPPEDWASRDDAALVEACLAGRRDAFGPLVERYQRQVYRVCYRFVGNHADAADLTQDVFIRAYRGLRGFKGKASLGTWLYRIAVNASLNRLAVSAPAHTALDADREDASAEQPDATLLRSERAAEVRAAIARLPKKQRATLILRIYHELPHEQIAAILGTSVGAAKANLFHALANLRKLLQ
jgi:RNA polymerase sigma-70 factor (ECF subfamily)